MLHKINMWYSGRSLVHGYHIYGGMRVDNNGSSLVPVPWGDVRDSGEDCL